MLFDNAMESIPDYVAVERRKVRVARVQVYPDGDVRIIVPRLFSNRNILGLYRNKQLWIDKKRAEFMARLKKRVHLAVDEVMLWGDVYDIRINPGQAKPRVIKSQRQVVCGGELLLPEQQLQWHRALARDYLHQRLEALAGVHGFRFNRLYIREQRTRWGSCSSRKNISLNWKLIKVPVRVSDYVILHELLHTRILNHSAKFWREMEKLDPKYEFSIAWLRDHGAFL